MANINVHEFPDKTPELTDIVPTQKSTGAFKYTWATLLNTILKLINRGLNAPTNTDSLWVGPDGNLYYNNGTTWVMSNGTAVPESHDFFVYVSPTGDDSSYMKGNSHYPAQSIPYVINHAGNTNSDVITLFNGGHTIKNSELFRSDRNKVTIQLWYGAYLTSDNITPMAVSSIFNTSFIISGKGGVNFYGVTRFIQDTSATRFGRISIDMDYMVCDGTSSNYDLGVITTFTQIFSLKLKDLTLTRSCPFFDFKSSGNNISNRHISIDNVFMYNTAFTAYNPGLINFRQDSLNNAQNISNIQIGHIEIQGVKEPSIFYSKNMMYNNSVINIRIQNINSKVVLSSTVPNANFTTTQQPAIISIEKTNLPTLNFTNSIFTIEIDTVLTGGTLLYIGDIGLQECTMIIKIKNAIVSRGTPIIIAGASLDKSTIIIDANITHYAKNGNTPIAIIHTNSSSSDSKVILKGNYRNFSIGKPCVQLLNGSDILELHDASFINDTASAFVVGESGVIPVAMKNVSTNSTITTTTITEQGESVVRNSNYN